MASKFLKTASIATLLTAISCGTADTPPEHPAVPYNGVEVLTNQDFDERVLEVNYPVVVDFWRERCSACTMVKPVFEKVCEEFAGKVACGSYDIWQDDRDDPERMSIRYGVRAVPAFRFFCRGEYDEPRGFTGSVNEEIMRQQLQELVDSCR
ncbi:MAG: thioredoxin [Nanoarchaeota archaeon]|nr:thioredoxin [Nanoarchaeota archaeon]